MTTLPLAARRGSTVVRRILALLAMLALAGASHAVGYLPEDLESGRRFSVRTWSITEGLPVASLVGLAQTADGYIWSGTEVGLVRFDGMRFVTFSKSTHPAMVDSDITAVAAGARGELWWGTRQGYVGRYRNGEFTAWPGGRGRVEAILVAPDGDVWFGGLNGLGVWRNGRYSTGGLPTTEIRALSIAPNGTLYVGGQNGILRRGAGGAFEPLPQPASRTFTRTLLFGRDGALWAGTDQEGVIRFAGDRVQRWNAANGLRANSVHSLVEDAGGAIWIGTNGAGVHRLASGTLSHIPDLDGALVWSLLPDREGSVWFATRGAGLGRLRRAPFLTLTSADGLAGDVILALNQEPGGALWVGTAGQGVTRIDGRSVTSYGAGKGFAGSVVLTIANDVDGSVLIGTVGQPLVRFHGGRFEPVDIGGAATDTVSAVLVARDGTAWIGSHRGLSTLRDKRWRMIATREELRNGQIVALLEDHAGRLWVGTDGGGLFVIEGGELRRMIAADGFPSDAVLALHETPDGVLWIGTVGAGVYRYDGARFVSFRKQHGLPDDSAHQLLDDGAGHLWIGSNRGVTRVPISDLHDVAAGRRKQLRVHRFGLADGLRTLEVNGGIFPPGLRRSDGTLWFPTASGLSVTDGKIGREAVVAPVIESMEVDGAARLLGDATPLRPGTKRVEIAFTAPTFLDAEDLAFRYRFGGGESEWVDARGSRLAYAMNLRPGDYAFELEVRGRDGVWRRTTAPLRFTIQPHFYQRTSFYVVVALLSGFLLRALHRFRTRVLRRRASALLKLVEEKTAAEAALRESEENFRSLVENSLDLILIVDDDGRIEYASPSASKLLAISPSDLLGRRMSELVHAHDDLQLTADVLSGFDTRPVASADLRLRRADGEYVSFTVVRHVIGFDGAHRRVLVNCRDTSLTSTLATQLEQANRVGSLGRLAATIAHEFNNVLMAMLPFAETIQKRSEERATRDMAVRIAQGITRGKRITEEILQFTRAVDPVVKPFPAASWLEDLRPELEEICGATVRLETVVHDRAAELLGDAMLLEQAMMNLVINAVHAMPGGGVLTVATGTLRRGATVPAGSGITPRDMVHISVRDTGHGIRPEILPRIFEPLYTTKKGGGTGLGLALVHQVVTRHGGVISVDSTHGEGTTFHILIPAAPR